MFLIRIGKKSLTGLQSKKAAGPLVSPFLATSFSIQLSLQLKPQNGRCRLTPFEFTDCGQSPQNSPKCSQFFSFLLPIIFCPFPTQFLILWTGTLIGPALIQSTTASSRAVMCLPPCPEISLGVIVRQTDTLKGVDHSCYVVDAFIVLNQ